MNSKVCVLTGATSGIGEAAALELARQGYELYLVARSKQKAAVTEAMIKAEVNQAQIHWLFGDLAKLADVRSIANQFLQTNRPIDLLFHNAGVTYNSRVESDDGYEMMLAVNHLAPFLLTELLFDKLCEGQHETRVVVTASGAYEFVKSLNIDDINWEQNFKTFPAYGNSKLANILFTKRLAKKLIEAAPMKTFSVNCFHPGFVGTNLGTQSTFGKIVMRLIRPFSRKSAKGAETGIYLATDESVSGKNGGYYFNCKLKQLKPHASDNTMAAALWQKSHELVLDKKP